MYNLKLCFKSSIRLLNYLNKDFNNLLRIWGGNKLGYTFDCFLKCSFKIQTIINNPTKNNQHCILDGGCNNKCWSLFPPTPSPPTPPAKVSCQAANRFFEKHMFDDFLSFLLIQIRIHEYLHGHLYEHLYDHLCDLLSSSPSRSEAVARETLTCKARGVLFRNRGLGEVFEKVFVNVIALGVWQRRNLDAH